MLKDCLTPLGSNTSGTSDKEIVLCAALPIDITGKELLRFLCSEQPNLHPFPERISDREAETEFLRITGLEHAADLARLPKTEQIRFFGIPQENDLTIQQMARLT